MRILTEYLVTRVSLVASSVKNLPGEGNSNPLQAWCPQYSSFIISSQKESMAGFKCQLPGAHPEQALDRCLLGFTVCGGGGCGGVHQLCFAGEGSCISRQGCHDLVVAPWNGIAGGSRQRRAGQQRVLLPSPECFRYFYWPHPLAASLGVIRTLQPLLKKKK